MLLPRALDVAPAAGAVEEAPMVEGVLVPKIDTIDEYGLPVSCVRLTDSQCVCFLPALDPAKSDIG